MSGTGIAFFLLSALCLLVFLYPFLIYPAILKRLPQRPLHAPTAAPRPRFSLVFCAYNEEKALPAKIGNLRRLKTRYPDLEILAYSDMSSDATLALLEAASDVLTPVAATARLGKASGMRRLVAMASGEIVIFTDANVLLDEGVVDRLADYFSDPAIGTVSGRLEYVNDDETTTADVGGRYWALEERIKALESATGSTMGADGSIFATRRALYPEVPPHLLDDLIASITPLFLGYRVISAPDVVAYERLATDSGDEWRRRRRIACRAFNTHRHLAPQLRRIGRLDRFKYASHRFVRWFGPLFLLLAGVFGVAGLVATLGPWPALALCAAGALGFWLLWRSGQGKARQAWEIVTTLAALGLGILESLQGKTYQTWAPAKSRNG